jgi:glycerol-3-phosphate dehydrogenase
VIPALRHILATYTFLARRHGWRAPLDELLVQGCLKEARQLASMERDEPAALFYVFSKAWARLGEACAVLPDLLSRNHARAVGLELSASPEEQRALRLKVASGAATFSDVREWFAAHAKPL